MSIDGGDDTLTPDLPSVSRSSSLRSNSGRRASASRISPAPRRPSPLAALPTELASPIATENLTTSPTSQTAPSSVWEEATRDVVLYVVKRLSLQFFFSAHVVLRIGKNAAEVADLPEGAETQIEMGLVDLDCLVFDALGMLSELIFFDIGKLLEKEIENAELIFQLNANNHVSIFQATSKQQKADIEHALRQNTPREKLAIMPEGIDPECSTIEGLDELLDHYTAACEVYKAEIKVLQKELRDRVDAFELLEKTWHQTHETNLIVLKSLEEMQHQNETLMSRLDEVNKSSKESAGKISTMQIRMEDKRRALTVKAAQVETMHQQLQQPEPAVKIEMYHLFAGAGAILFIAFIAHYIWLVVQVTKLSSQTR